VLDVTTLLGEHNLANLAGCGAPTQTAAAALAVTPGIVMSEGPGFD
jgi:hypothetical protein